MRGVHVLYQGNGLPRPAPLSVGKRFRLGWGKLRRLYLIHFQSEYVQESLKRRVGECHRTGACCELMFPCPLLDWLNRLPFCRLYNRRPASCSLFPIDERDLRDRDLVNPWEPCGFSFLTPHEARERRSN